MIIVGYEEIDNEAKEKVNFFDEDNNLFNSFYCYYKGIDLKGKHISLYSNFKKNVALRSIEKGKEFEDPFKIDNLLHNYEVLNEQETALFNEKLQKELEDSELDWENRLYEIYVNKKLTSKEIKELKLSIGSRPLSKAIALATIPIAFGLVIGVSSHNVIMGSNAIATAHGFVTGSLGYFLAYAYCTQYALDEKSIKEISQYISDKAVLLDQQNLNKEQLKIALYYNILFEAIKKTPNTSKIIALNNERDKLLGKKNQDEFSYDINKYFTRVRK